MMSDEKRILPVYRILAGEVMMCMKKLLAILIIHMSLIRTMGCTHNQLRRNTVNQMATVHDIQQQQVLDNLAMFVANRNAYPYYSVVSQGTSQLIDQGTLNVSSGFIRNSTNFIFSSLGINPSTSVKLWKHGQ